jgi:hypothetical protein
LVTKLKDKGVGNAYALVGGTAAWKKAKVKSRNLPHWRLFMPKNFYLSA